VIRTPYNSANRSCDTLHPLYAFALREAAMAAFAKSWRREYSVETSRPPRMVAGSPAGCTEALLYGISADVLVELINRPPVELLRSPSRQLAVSVCVAKPSLVQAYRVGVLARGLPAKAFVAKLAR